MALIVNKINIGEPILLKIGEFADELGVKVYAVGGFVRDYFLGRRRTDIDCTVVGDSLDFANRLAKRFHRKAVIFERFRTAMVPIDGLQIEFVGTRKEIYEPNSRKPITAEGTLEDDLARRDFTVNAMAASINKSTFGEIVDLFNGQEDLEKQILRTPLDPITTYSDDPLRMMRAARFAAQLEFELDESSVAAITKMADRIKIISQERITDELFKTLAADSPSIGLKILRNTGLLKFVFPELDNMVGIDTVDGGDKIFGHKDAFYHSLKVLDNICKVTDNKWLRFAALTHDIAKPRTKRFIEGTGWSFYGHEELGARMMGKIFRRMKFPLEYLEYVETLIRMHQRPMQLVNDGVTDSAVRRLAFQAGFALEDLFTLCRADITTKNSNLTVKYLNNYDLVAQKVIEVQERDKLREFQSPVRGEEIMELCELAPSRPVGIIKNLIEEAILDGIIPNDYDQAKEYFLSNKNKWLEDIKNGILK